MVQVGYTDNANHKLKSGTEIGHTDGTMHKIKLIEVGGADGVNHVVWKSDIEWILSIDSSCGTNENDLTNVSSTCGAYDEVAQTTATYTFTSPIVFKSGDTIKLNTYSPYKAYRGRVCLNGSNNIICETGEFTAEGIDISTYTFSANTTVSSIEVDVWTERKRDEESDCDSTVTLTTDGKSFILNNSGTSDQ